MAYKTPKDVQERKDANRRHILDTAAKVFAAKGYHSTTVKAIVDEAGMSVGSFYFYFKNKEELFETLYDEMVKMLFDSLECAVIGAEIGTPRTISRSITSFLWEIQRNKELARIMMVEAVGLNPRFERKRAEATKSFCDDAEVHLRAIGEKGKIDIPDVKIVAIALIGTMYNAISYWLQNDEEVKLTDYAYTLIVYNLQALKIEFDKEALRKYIEEVLTEKNL